MQSLSWYARRLGAMSPGELWWRLGGKARDAVDRCLVSARRRPVSLRRIAEANGRQLAVRHEAIGSAGVDGWTLAGGSTTSWLAEWRERIVPLADALIRNRLPLFDIQTRDLGQGIDWNREYKAGKRAPMCHASAIDYRDHAVTGDCKFVWEPNRHQHLVVLGRAYRLTGEQRYARTVLEHIGSWIEQCPFGMGMNWRSPLELAIRLINWAWALELIRPSGLVDGERMRGLLPVVYRHLWSIARNYSRYSSANNHLIGEAAGVLVASSYFESLRESRRWRDEASKILVREIAAQTHEDGGTREQAMGYHLFVLEFFVLAGLAAERVGVALPRSYWDRLERMFEFLAAFVEGGGAVVDVRGRG